MGKKEYDYSLDGLALHIRDSVDEQIRERVMADEESCNAMFVHEEIMEMVDKAIIKALAGALRFAVLAKVGGR